MLGARRQQSSPADLLTKREPNRLLTPAPLVSSPAMLDLPPLQDWKSFTNARYKFSFKYPADLIIGDSPDNYVTFYSGRDYRESSLGNKAVWQTSYCNEVLLIVKALPHLKSNYKSLKAIYEEVAPGFAQTYVDDKGRSWTLVNYGSVTGGFVYDADIETKTNFYSVNIQVGIFSLACYLYKSPQEDVSRESDILIKKILSTFEILIQ